MVQFVPYCLQIVINHYKVKFPVTQVMEFLLANFMRYLGYQIKG
nr:MAG TPA: hypothetical protein [Bacteriophage sp.]